MRLACRRGGAGFTLLEVIVALAVSGLLVAAVYAAVDAAVDTRDRNARVQEAARRERNGRMLLSSLLRSARLDPAVPETAFRGEDGAAGGDELRFVAVLAVPLLGHAGGETVGVHVRREPGQGLVLTVTGVAGAPSVAGAPAGESGGTRPPGKGLVVLPGVEALEARYLDGGTGVWETAWTRPDALPDAVALAFVTEPPLPILLVDLPVQATEGPP